MDRPPVSLTDSLGCAIDPSSDNIALLSQVIETQNDISAVELDPSIVMQIIVERTQKLAGAQGALLQFMDDQEMVFRATSGSMAPHVGLRLPVSSSMCGRCATTGELLHCTDTQSDPRILSDIYRRLNIRSMILVPLTHQGKHAGVLTVVSDQPSAFSAPSILGLQLMAGLLGAALTHASEFEIKKRLLVERTSALSALRSSEAEYRAIFELAGVGKAQADLQSGRFLRVNKKLCEMVGYTQEELLALSFNELTHPDDRPTTTHSMEKMLDGEIAQWSVEKRYLHKNGRTVWIRLNTTMIHDPAGDRPRGVATIEDITATKRAEWLESDRRKILEMVVQDLPLDAVLSQLADAVQRQVPGSLAAVMLLRDGDISLMAPGFPEDWQAALRQSSLPLAVKLSTGAWESPDNCGVTLLDSDPIWQDWHALAKELGLAACWAFPIQSTDGTPIGLLTLFSQDSRFPAPADLQTLGTAAQLATRCIEHHTTTRQLAHLVRHDSLTRLPNRIMFEDRLQQAIALAHRNKKSAALLALDIDNFKSINDTFGHSAGDHLLQQFAQRLRSLLRKNDTLGRLSGDEFAIILPHIANTDEALLLAQKIIASLVQPFDIENVGTLRATASLGIAVFPTDGEDSPTLHKKADAALYRAKANGRNGCSL